MTLTVDFTLDGAATSITVTEAAITLLDILRQQLGKTGTRAGCRNGDCGACTVLIDGEAYKSCLVPAWRVTGTTVETIQGLAPNGEPLHPVQQAFRNEDGFQCGFCLAGSVLCLVSLLRTNPDPTDQSIVDSLVGNLCRCTGYQQIMTAARAATDP
ncbi:(2Fe-2S)-binding protein [Amycolatopsis sp. GM8]|uniref:(2Fe-2S)-binding protein n=1 Tax=Amycolatopsis sp. GM8 TaxID=2896530 RepID=UPI001F3D72DB|nr:(2Fe-2S)-binding protein [Amycolatopsis sp. GM8]